MKMTRAEILALPPLDPPRNVRIKFAKSGRLQYISHLDLQRTMARALARSGIPVWFTKGFNPRAKMIFSAPLALGVESKCELLDIRVDRDISCEAIKELLNAELTQGLHAIDVYIPTTKFSDIAAADYLIEIMTEGDPAELRDQIDRALTTSPLMAVKRTKSGTKEIDIVPMILKLKTGVSMPEGTIQLSLMLPAGNTENLSPELLISALRERVPILRGDPTAEWYTIMRCRLYDADRREFS